MVWSSGLVLVEGGEQPGAQLAGFDVLGRGFDDSPPEQGGLVHLGSVFYKSPPPGMPTAGVDPAVDFERNHVGRPGEVESPFALGVEQQLRGWVRKANQLGQHLVVKGCDLLGLAHLISCASDLRAATQQPGRINGGEVDHAALPMVFLRNSATSLASCSNRAFSLPCSCCQVRGAAWKPVG